MRTVVVDGNDHADFGFCRDLDRLDPLDGEIRGDRQRPALRSDTVTEAASGRAPRGGDVLVGVDRIDEFVERLGRIDRQNPDLVDVGEAECIHRVLHEVRTEIGMPGQVDDDVAVSAGDPVGVVWKNLHRTRIRLGQAEGVEVRFRQSGDVDRVIGRTGVQSHLLGDRVDAVESGVGSERGTDSRHLCFPYAALCQRPVRLLHVESGVGHAHLRIEGVHARVVVRDDKRSHRLQLDDSVGVHRLGVHNGVEIDAYGQKPLQIEQSLVIDRPVQMRQIPFREEIAFGLRELLCVEFEVAVDDREIRSGRQQSVEDPLGG